MPLSEATKQGLRRASMDDLRELNSFVVKCINEKAKERATAKLQEFRIGEVVSFRNKRGVWVAGTIRTINEKTVSLDTCTDGNKWRVHAAHLEHGDKVPKPATIIGSPSGLYRASA